MEGSSRFRPGFTEVPPRFHQGCASFVICLGCQKVLGRFPHHFFNLSPSSSNLFGISPSSAIVKVLVQNDTFVFWGSLQQNAFAPQKVLWSVPETVLYIHWSHTLLPFFWANGCCFRKGSVEGSADYSLHLSLKWLLLPYCSLEGSANCFLHLSHSLLLGSKLCELLTCLTHTNPVRRKRPIMSLLLGYSLGFFFLDSYHWASFWAMQQSCLAGQVCGLELPGGHQ